MLLGLPPDGDVQDRVNRLLPGQPPKVAEFLRYVQHQLLAHSEEADVLRFYIDQETLLLGLIQRLEGEWPGFEEDGMVDRLRSAADAIGFGQNFQSDLL